MPAIDAANIAMCNFKKTLGVKIKLFTTDPGTATNPTPIVTTPTSYDTTWGTTAMGSGGDANYAVSVGAVGSMTIPASTVAAYFGVYDNSNNYQYSQPLTTSVQSGAGGPLSVDVQPKIRVRES